MGYFKLVDKYIVCQQVKTNKRIWRISSKILNKAKGGNIYQTFYHQLALNDVICNSCYYKMIEYDIYQKYRKNSYTNVTKYNRTFLKLKLKKKCVTMDINTY